MVGLIEKPEHVTTQWFKDEGDAILLFGDPVDTNDPLLGLGGSAWLQRCHKLKTGTPPRCDLDREKELHLALRALIHAGNIKSAHDCSEGGLAVALAESCISHHVGRNTPVLHGATIDLTAWKNHPPAALLFGESQARVIVSVGKLDAVKVVERAKLLGIPAAQLGQVGGEKMTIRTAAGEFSWTLTDLHDLWWNSIARAMAE